MQKLKEEIYPIQNPIVQDAYDSMIAALHTHKANPKTVCVTGGAPGIGKTTISVNLALSLALTGRKVLLVDTDMRKENKLKRLSPEGFLGLSDYLFKTVDLSDVITATNVPTLHILTCGDGVSHNPLGMLYSPRFSSLLETVKKEYDYAIFDTSALSANADPAVVASLTDGTFMIVSPDESTTVYRKNLGKLKDMGVSVISVVFNKAPRSEYKNYMEFYSETRLKRAKQKSARHNK